MSKALDYAVQYANFCRNERFDPSKLRTLIEAVLRAATYQVTAHNREGEQYKKRADNAMKKVENLAKELRLETEWPGLYPSFRNNFGGERSETLHLPMDGV